MPARPFVLSLALSLATVACRRAPPPAPAPSLAVELSGCAAVVRRGERETVCEIPRDLKLRIWINASPGAALSVDAGKGPLAAKGISVQGGLLVTADVAEGAKALKVAAERAGAVTTFTQELAPRTIDPALDEAEALRRRGDLDGAGAVLQRLIDAKPGPAALLAKRKLARIERARGRGERAQTLFEEAILRDAEAGRVSDEIEDRLALTFTLLFPSRRLAEARRAIEGVRPIEPLDAHNRALAPYFRGWIAYEAGDLRAALGHFREASERQERLGLASDRANVFEPWADALSLLGRHEEAGALLREAESLLPPDTSPCRRAALLNNRGWFALRAGPAAPGGGVESSPIELILKAIALHEQGCKGPSTLANYLTNAALAEVDRGRATEAQAHLDKARSVSPSPGPRIELWWLVLAGKIALARGDPAAALTAFERLASFGETLILPEARFTAALGKADALDALGRSDAASAAYADAEAQLDVWSRSVPLGEGRETFFAKHEESAAARIDFLIRRGRVEDAAIAARASRSRLLGALGWIERSSALSPEARGAWESALGSYRREREALDRASAEDWKIPKNKLDAALAARAAEQGRLRAALEEALSKLGVSRPSAPPRAPGEGEVMLVYHPVGRGGARAWVGFAVSARDVVMARLGAIDSKASPEQLGAALLDRFDASIAKARRVTVAAHGLLERADVHALPYHGKPLLAHAEVAYAADLPPLSPEARPDHPSAVVVANPRGDLEGADREAESVARALARRGVEVQSIERGAATHTALRDAVERRGVTTLHYAGHGVFDGKDGWESALPLARGGLFTVGDITALRRAPEEVILSGCETARTWSGAGLGLGQAFLIAGARVAIAAKRVVDDAASARIMTALHERPSGEDLVSALRRAALAEREAHETSDWSSFRALVR